VKIGPVDTEIALLIVKKEEINASKIDSPSASLPSGLKKKKKKETEGKIYSPFGNFCRAG